MQRGWVGNPNKARHDAESGDIDAQLYLGNQSFRSGKHSSADFKYTETYYWYEKAAKQGNFEAMISLVTLYEHGLGGVKRNIEKTCEWMDTYIHYGNSGAETLLEYFSERDPAIVKNYLIDYALYLIGAPQILSEENSSPPQSLPLKKQDGKKACELLEKAANIFNCMESISLLYGRIYMVGLPNGLVEMDYDKGMYWMLRGIQNGDGESALKLALAFTTGVIPVNLHLQSKFLQIAEKLGYPDKSKHIVLALQHRLDPDKANKNLRDIDREKNIENLLGTDEFTVCSSPNCDQEEGDDPFMSCSKCCSVKYCGRSCQVYHWKNGHKKVCKQMQQIKEEIKENNRNNHLADARVCFNSKCRQVEQKNGVKFQQCSRCKAAIYCSRECQKYHSNNGHKEACKKTLIFFKEADRVLDALNKGEFQKPNNIFSNPAVET
jgi:TPR repeat protein